MHFLTHSCFWRKMWTMNKIKQATKNMTAEEVAQKTGIKVRTVRSHAQGQRRPGVETLKRYSQGLGVDLRDLIEDTTAQHNDTT